MQRSSDSIDLAKKMSKDLDRNYLPELELANLHTIFRPIYKHNLTIGAQNTIVAFIIFSYSEDSPWLNPRKDRNTNKREILEGLGADPDNRIYKEILDYTNDSIHDVTISYLMFQKDSRWVQIASLLDYSDKMMLFGNQRTSEKQKTGTSETEEKGMIDVFEYLDQSEIAKINKEKGELLLKAIDARTKAESLIKAIENDYQKLDAVTNAEFGISFTDTKVDILSWESRLKARRAQKNF